MKYNKNDDIVNMLNDIINKSDISKAELARRIGMSPQGLNNTFAKKNINLDDIKRITDALGYDVDITISDKNGNNIIEAPEGKVEQKTLEAIASAQEMGIRNKGGKVEFYTQYKNNVDALQIMEYYTKLLDAYMKLQGTDRHGRPLNKQKDSEPPAPKGAEQSEAERTTGHDSIKG